MSKRKIFLAEHKKMQEALEECQAMNAKLKAAMKALLEAIGESARKNNTEDLPMLTSFIEHMQAMVALSASRPFQLLTDKEVEAIEKLGAEMFLNNEIREQRRLGLFFVSIALIILLPAVVTPPGLAMMLFFSLLMAAFVVCLFAFKSLRDSERSESVLTAWKRVINLCNPKSVQLKNLDVPTASDNTKSTELKSSVGRFFSASDLDTSPVTSTVAARAA